MEGKGEEQKKKVPGTVALCTRMQYLCMHVQLQMYKLYALT